MLRYAVSSGRHPPLSCSPSVCSPARKRRHGFSAAAAMNVVDVDGLALHQQQGGEEDKMVKEISEAVQQCLTTLKGLWADVGVDPAGRESVCREIALDVDRALQAKISDARETKAQTALKIRLALRRMKAIYAQLGVAPPATDFTCVDDASSPDSVNSLPCGEMGLLLQLVTLEGMLATADAQRAARLQDFTCKTDKLRQLLVEQYGVLDAEREGCLALSGETDLSDAREQLLIKAIAAGVAARAARAKDIKECVATMHGLWDVLGSDEDQQGTEQGKWAGLDAQIYGGVELKPSTAVLNSTKERLASLQALEEVRREAVSALISSLQQLWTRVQTPLEEQEAYLQEHTGITVQDIQHHETTLAALERTLHDMLPGLLAIGTERMSQLQKALLEDASPVCNLSDSLTISALEEVEAAVTSAEARLELRQGVLGLIERRDAILKEAAELKNAGQDPSRLLDKSAGSFRARQQEEKRRNMVRTHTSASLQNAVSLLRVAGFPRTFARKLCEANRARGRGNVDARNSFRSTIT